MQNDPGQINNLLADQDASALASQKVNGFTLDRIVPRLDALKMVLKSCKGNTCVEPWLSLHPSGTVNSLSKALHESYDTFYTTQDKVGFTSCELGCIVEAEGPQSVFAFPNLLTDIGPSAQKPLLNPDWSMWV